LSLRFRGVSRDDVPEVARLAAHSFPGVGHTRAEWEDRLGNEGPHGLDSLWIAEEEGRMRGACRLLSYQQWIAGAAVPIMGLSTVAVSAAARRRGVAAELVASAMRQARERGDLASLLYPFRTAFYRKLGYGMAGEALQYRIPPAALPDDPARLRVEIAATPSDREAMALVYDRWAPLQNGQIFRPPDAWSRVWDDDTRHAAVYRSENGEATGYITFRYHLDRQTKSSVEVEEIAWLDGVARSALYGWLASLADQWDLIVYRAHPQELFAEHLSELRHSFPGKLTRWHFWFPAAVSLAGPMFRLLDVERSWGVRPLNEGRSLTMALHVHDSHLEENHHWWTLRMANTRTAVSRERPQSPDLTLETDIETLSRIYIGSLAPTAAVLLGRARVDRPNMAPQLDRLLSVRLPWTFDRF
jgi:predicted acetyltransferase